MCQEWSVLNVSSSHRSLNLKSALFLQVFGSILNIFDQGSEHEPRVAIYCGHVAFHIDLETGKWISDTETTAQCDTNKEDVKRCAKFIFNLPLAILLFLSFQLSTSRQGLGHREPMLMKICPGPSSLCDQALLFLSQELQRGGNFLSKG